MVGENNTSEVYSGPFRIYPEIFRISIRYHMCGNFTHKDKSGKFPEVFWICRVEGEGGSAAVGPVDAV